MAKQAQDEDLNVYLQASEELSEDLEQTPDQDQEQEQDENENDQPLDDSEIVTARRFHFWSKWPKKKKIIVLCSAIFTTILIIFVILFFVIRPSKTNSYMKSSWHSMVADSSDIDRAVSSEVNLDGTRDLANSLYAYNQKLGKVSFDSKSKSSFSYNTASTKELSDLSESVSLYFSDSAASLAKTNTDIESIADSDIDSLQTKGTELKTKVDAFRQKYKLEEDFNPNMFAMDAYIREVKTKVDEIEKEKKAEEAKKEQEKQDAAAKETKDKSSVTSVADTYFKAFINGNEAGVRATLSKGYQAEYDFNALKTENRTSYYPKSYRLISVDKDGDNYKVNASVTFVYVYQGADGQSSENTQPSNLIYRVVYSPETGSWKIDGQTDR